jgi:threonine dehydratase
MTLPRLVGPPTTDDIDRARRLIARILTPTPTNAMALSDSLSLVLKLEGLQPTGSFKVRGALAALDASDPERPVVTASAGNHGLGVAYAAKRLKLRAVVVVSTKASIAKVAAIRRFGVELIQVGTSFDHAEAHAKALAADGTSQYVSAYNDPHVIAGQSTIGFELDAQLSGPLTVVCPIGGGGLASGLGLWASTRPDVQIIGVEAAASTAVSAAVQAGRQVPVAVGDTLADGLAGNLEPQSVTIDLIARYVHSLVTVSEDEIRDAIRYLALERGVVAEGAGAAAVAAVLGGRVPTAPTTVAIVSGRNVSRSALASVLT